MLPLPATGLSPLSEVRGTPGPRQKVTSDLGLGSCFCLVLQFPQPVTTGQSRLSLNMTEKVTKRNPKL